MRSPVLARQPRIATRRKRLAAAEGRRKRPRSLPALIIAASVALLTLGVALGLASLPGSQLTAGTAGPSLARLLALAAGAAGLFGVSTGILVAGEAPTVTGLAPAVAVGMFIGGLQALFLLIPITGPLALAPWAFIALALPPVLRLVGIGR